jgi:hypothetical protein
VLPSVSVKSDHRYEDAKLCCERVRHTRLNGRYSVSLTPEGWPKAASSSCASGRGCARSTPRAGPFAGYWAWLLDVCPVKWYFSSADDGLAVQEDRMSTDWSCVRVGDMHLPLVPTGSS